MGMDYTKVKVSAPAEMQLNAGVLLSEFDPTTGEMDLTKIIAATTGGLNFKATPSYVDFGADVDNLPDNMMEFKEIDAIEVRLSGTYLSVTPDLAKSLTGAADIENVTSTTHTVKKITPRGVLTDADFEDFWYVGDYGKGGLGYVAIHIMNALNTGGFQLQSADKGKGQFAFDFLGHYSIDDQDTVPYEIYIGTKIVTP